MEKISLEEKVMQKLKIAMKAKDTTALESLRAIKSAILLQKTNGIGNISQEDEISLLQKLVKQRNDSANQFNDQGRIELAEKEKSQAEIIMEFLPEQLSQKELYEKMKNIATNTKAESMKDLGKLISEANKQLKGRAEGKLIAQIAKEILAN